jgi:halimadienyl-diphosphate synthase
MMALEQRAPRPATILGDPSERPGIAGTAYDTAWIASVPHTHERRAPHFPAALQWLVEHQWPDGSWGGAVRYEHDRILCTLAALAPLATFGRRDRDRDCLAAGTRYLWQHGHLLPSEPAELVGFELLLPTLVRRARDAGVAVPPHLDVYGPERAEKLRLLPAAGLYSPYLTVAHSLEFLGDAADADGLQAAQGANGALGNSPAATAFAFAHTRNPRARAYLEACLARTGGAMAPVLHPCETFELLWSAYHLSLAGLAPASLVQPDERQLLRRGLETGGISLSPSFPIPDADDTAVALLLLHDLGETVDPRVLKEFERDAQGHFVSFPHERHSSVGVNLHVLHALARVPGYPEVETVLARLVDYLASEQIGGLYWIDKWHISPYYATAHALCILREVPMAAARLQPAIDRAGDWIRQTQNADGSWGFYGQPTVEETAYAVLALARSGDRRGDRQRCAAGLRFMRAAYPMGASEPTLPPLWIDKCLYTPTLIVRSVIESARAAVSRRWGRAPATLAVS